MTTPLDPRYIQGSDGLMPSEREHLDAMATWALARELTQGPYEWSRSASMCESQDTRRAAARRAYIRKLIAQRETPAEAVQRMQQQAESAHRFMVREQQAARKARETYERVAAELEHARQRLAATALQVEVTA